MVNARRGNAVLPLALSVWVHGCASAPRGTSNVDATQIDPGQVVATERRVADWQLANPVPFDPRHWAMAPLYDGLIDASLATGDPKYLAAVVRAGRRIAFQPGRPIYHADAYAAGHAWLRIYLMQPRDPTLLEPFKARFDEILAKPISEPLSFTKRPTTPGVAFTDRWTWEDALYMSPPTLALLAKATATTAISGFIDSEFKATYDALFDPPGRTTRRSRARWPGSRPGSSSARTTRRRAASGRGSSTWRADPS